MSRRGVFILLAALGVAVLLFALASGFSSLGREATVPGAMSYEVLAQRYHQGDGPCLRYYLGPVSREDTEGVAELLFEAGFTPQEYADSSD